MITVCCVDSVALSEPRMTQDGYMVVDAKAARIGIQIYTGDQVGRSDLGQVRVFRPEAEVFDAKALASFSHRPVTNDHPLEMVSAQNWKEHSVGMTGDSIVRDGHFVRIPFTLMDASAISAVQGGKRELSAGYTCEIDWTSGTTPEGEAYDAVQRNIRGNHLAVVQRGRAGSACRIGDSWNSPPQQKERLGMPDNLRTIMVDGISISATDQSAQAIEKLQNELREARSSVSAKDTALTSANTEHARALNAKDGVIDALRSSHTTALSAKDGEIDALKAKLPDASALDALLIERDTVIGVARKMLGDSFDPKGKSNADIRRSAVMKRMGDAAKDRDDAYVAAAFDALSHGIVTTTSSVIVDPLRRALGDIKLPVLDANEGKTAHDEMVSRYANAWQTPVQGAR